MGKQVEPISTLGAPRGAQHEVVKNRVCVARIGAAHGTGGEVRLWPFTTRAEAVAVYGPLQTVVARLKGVTDRAAAERLCNTDLYVPRERLPIPEPEEFYYADLIGLRAEDTTGRAIGVVMAVHNFGAGDILEIAPTAGGDTVMLPFSTAAVPSVEVAIGRIVVEAPEGLLAPEDAAASVPVAEKNKGA